MTATATSSATFTWQEQSPQEKDAVEMVGACVHQFEEGIGRDFKERCDHLYRQYRGFKKFKNIWEAAGPNDRDVVINDAKKDWGSNLHIPYAFSTVETMVPRAIAQRPGMIYLPRRQQWEGNAENLRELIDWQQHQIDVELTWQDIMRSGFIYGLGVGKSFWRKEYAPKRDVKPRMLGIRFPGQSPYYVSKLRQALIFDDPDLEDVDIYDFMWDPYGFSAKSCRWMTHRLWMSRQDVIDRLLSGVWNTDAAKLLAAEPSKLDTLGGDSQKYDEIWRERMIASGMDLKNMRLGDRPHEVWEYHNGDEVLTVLDRAVLVQRGENPLVGQMPFQLYRPTPLQKQMVGIGEIEPIDHLGRELDTLRSMMLDAGIIAMCAGYAYDDAAIDEEDLVFGPAQAIRVNNARPQDAIWPLPKPELPNSAYQNSQAIMADIERVTGVNDALAGGDGGSISTATEAQLVQASLSKRVELKSRRFEVEVCRAAARQFLALNQRMILADREQRLPAQGADVQDALTTGAWRYVQLGPLELQGEFLVMAEGGTMAAENVPQMRNDAIQLGNMFGQDPTIDQTWLKTKQLRLMGEKHPNEALAQQDPPLPPVVLEVLAKQGVPAETIQKAVGIAQQMQPQLREAGQTGMPPTAADVQQVAA